MIFNPFLAMDKPYNLLPSLHITLRTILADLYARKSRGFVNLSLHVWFSLVGLSTLLTHQHHVIDVLGGFALAGISIYFFRPMSHRLPVIPNYKMSVCYGLLALLMMVLCTVTWREGVLFLWPTLAMLIVSWAYLGGGPGIYRKSNGRLPSCANTWPRS